MNKIRVKARAPSRIACLAERVRKVSDRLMDIDLQLELDNIYDELRGIGERRAPVSHAGPTLRGRGVTVGGKIIPVVQNDRLAGRKREGALGAIKMDDYGLGNAQAMHDAQEPRESAAIYCPVCGRECEDYVLTYFGEISGCDRCTKRVDALTYLIENK